MLTHYYYSGSIPGIRSEKETPIAYLSSCHFVVKTWLLPIQQSKTNAGSLGCERAVPSFPVLNLLKGAKITGVN